jgi:hypothetical protein
MARDGLDLLRPGFGMEAKLHSALVRASNTTPIIAEDVDTFGINSDTNGRIGRPLVGA